MNLTRRLQKAIIVTSLGVVLVITLAYFFELSKLSNSYKSVAADIHLEAVKKLAVVINDEISDAIGTLSGIAEISDVIEYSESVEDCNNTMMRIVGSVESRFVNLSRLDTNGVFVCSATAETTVGLKASDFGTYIQSLIDDPGHNPVISPVIMASGENTNGPVLAIHVPVYRNGDFDGTVGGAFSINEFRDGALRDLVGDSGAIVTVIDENGNIVMSTLNSIDRRNIYSGIPFDIISSEEQLDLKRVANSIFTLRPGTETFRFLGKEHTHSYTHTEVTPQRYWGVIISVETDGTLATKLNSVFKKVGYEFFSLTLTILLLAALLFYLYTKYKILVFYDRVIVVIDAIKKGNIKNLKQYIEDNNIDFINNDVLELDAAESRSANTDPFEGILEYLQDVTVLLVDNERGMLESRLHSISSLLSEKTISKKDFLKKFKKPELIESIVSGENSNVVKLETVEGRWYEISRYENTVDTNNLVYIIARDVTLAKEQDSLIQQKTVELQNLNKAMIAREVRIAELKEKNARKK